MKNILTINWPIVVVILSFVVAPANAKEIIESSFSTMDVCKDTQDKALTTSFSRSMPNFSNANRHNRGQRAYYYLDKGRSCNMKYLSTSLNSAQDQAQTVISADILSRVQELVEEERQKQINKIDGLNKCMGISTSNTQAKLDCKVEMPIFLKSIKKSNSQMRQNLAVAQAPSCSPYKFGEYTCKVDNAIEHDNWAIGEIFSRYQASPDMNKLSPAESKLASDNYHLQAIATETKLIANLLENPEWVETNSGLMHANMRGVIKTITETSLKDIQIIQAEGEKLNVSLECQYSEEQLEAQDNRYLDTLSQMTNDQQKAQFLKRQMQIRCGKVKAIASQMLRSGGPGFQTLVAGKFDEIKENALKDYQDMIAREPLLKYMSSDLENLDITATDKSSIDKKYRGDLTQALNSVKKNIVSQREYDQTHFYDLYVSHRWAVLQALKEIPRSSGQRGNYCEVVGLLEATVKKRKTGREIILIGGTMLMGGGPIGLLAGGIGYALATADSTQNLMSRCLASFESSKSLGCSAEEMRHAQSSANIAAGFGVIGLPGASVTAIRAASKVKNMGLAGAIETLDFTRRGLDNVALHHPSLRAYRPKFSQVDRKLAYKQARIEIEKSFGTFPRDAIMAEGKGLMLKQLKQLKEEGATIAEIESQLSHQLAMIRKFRAMEAQGIKVESTTYLGIVISDMGKTRRSTSLLDGNFSQYSNAKELKELSNLLITCGQGSSKCPDKVLEGMRVFAKSYGEATGQDPNKIFKLFNSEMSVKEIQNGLKNSAIDLSVMHEIPGIAYLMESLNKGKITPNEFASALNTNLFHNGPSEGFWGFLVGLRNNITNPKSKEVFNSTMFADATGNIVYQTPRCIRVSGRLDCGSLQHVLADRVSGLEGSAKYVAESAKPDFMMFTNSMLKGNAASTQPQLKAIVGRIDETLSVIKNEMAAYVKNSAGGLTKRAATHTKYKQLVQERDAVNIIRGQATRSLDRAKSMQAYMENNITDTFVSFKGGTFTPNVKVGQISQKLTYTDPTWAPLTSHICSC